MNEGLPCRAAALGAAGKGRTVRPAAGAGARGWGPEQAEPGGRGGRGRTLSDTGLVEDAGHAHLSEPAQGTTARGDPAGCTGPG